MKYYKNLTNGGVIKTEKTPEGAWWREVTENEYNTYRAHVTHLMANLEKAIARKRAILSH